MRPCFSRQSLHIVALLPAFLFLVGCDPVDNAITALQQGVHSIQEIQKILEGVQSRMDAGQYRDQVTEIIGRVGQTTELAGQAYIDFIRTRVVEDLLRAKAVARHKPVPPRVPVLATVAQPDIDFTSHANTTVKIVGWNLDIASNDPQKYSVIIRDRNQQDRAVDRTFVSYQGQYEVTVDVSSGGVPLHRGDRQLIFNGYQAPFEISIVRSELGTQLTGLIIQTVQDVDNKDNDINANFVLEVDGITYVNVSAGKHDMWGNRSIVNVFVRALENTRVVGACTNVSLCYGFALPNFANIPPLTGTSKARLTIMGLEDDSGWAGHVRILGYVAGEPEYRVIASEDFKIHRGGAGGTAEFKDIPW